MSGGIKSGVTSRRILTIMAAVAAVAMMIAVSVFAAADADADFEAADVGYKAELIDPTDAQFEAIKTTRYEAFDDAIFFELEVFRESVLGEPTLTADKIFYTRGEGQKISGNQEETIDSFKLKTVEDFELKYDIIADGSLITDSIVLNEKQKAAGKAIGDYYGDVAVGDKFEITGRIDMEYATKNTYEYKLLDGNKYIDSKDTTSTFYRDDIELTFKLIRGEEVKEIKLVSNVKGFDVIEKKYVYADSEIKIGTSYTIKSEVSETCSGDEYYVVNGTNYSIIGEIGEIPDEPGEVDDLPDQSEMALDTDLKDRIDSISAASEEGLIVTKTYSDAESVFDSVALDVVGEDLFKMILIGLAVFFGILILIVIILVIFFVRKKKRAR